MAEITFDFNTSRHLLELTQEECRILLPIVQKEAKKAFKKYMKQVDEVASGYAEDEETDKMQQFEEQYECLTQVGNHMNILVNNPKFQDL